MTLSSRQLSILKFVRQTATLLDQAFTIPGTKIKIGIDPIIGLIPFFGDIIGFILSSFIIIAAVLLPASPWTIARMVVNLIIETVVGVIPLVGDGFDIFWKANVRNRQLLENYLEAATTRPKKDRAFLIVTFSTTVLVLLSLLTVGIYGMVQMVSLLVSLFHA